MLASRVQLGSVPTNSAQLTVLALSALLVLHSVLLSGALGSSEHVSGGQGRSGRGGRVVDL